MAQALTPARRAEIRAEANRSRRAAVPKQQPRRRNRRKQQPTLVPQQRAPIPGSGMRVKVAPRANLEVLNAFKDQVFGLPQSVAPYLFWRQTTIISTNKHWTVLGPMLKRLGDGTQDLSPGWFDRVGFSIDDTDNFLGATAPVTPQWHDFAASTNPGASVVPAAFSVRVLGRAPLTSAAKPVYIWRTTAGCKWRAMAASTVDSLTVFEPVFSCSRALAETDVSLAMKPKRIDAVPSNMTEYCRFADFLNPGTSGDWNVSGADFGALSPIFIKNPSAADLTFEVCLLWRCRPGFDNPMALGATRHHPATSDSSWETVLRNAHAATQLVESGASAITEMAGAAAAVGALL